MKSARRLATVASALATIALGTPVRAQVITFVTTGQFTGGAVGCSDAAAAVVVTCGIGTSFILFNGVVSANFSPSNVIFGFFQTAGGVSSEVFAGITFTMYINQTLPSASAGAGQAVTSSLNGNLSFLNSTINSFSPNPAAFDLGTGQTVRYTVLETPILRPATSGGISQINGTVAINAPVAVVPEPSTYAMLVAGLAAMGVASRRRRVT